MSIIRPMFMTFSTPRYSANFRALPERNGRHGTSKLGRFSLIRSVLERVTEACARQAFRSRSLPISVSLVRYCLPYFSQAFFSAETTQERTTRWRERIDRLPSQLASLGLLQLLSRVL